MSSLENEDIEKEITFVGLQSAINHHKKSEDDQEIMIGDDWSLFAGGEQTFETFNEVGNAKVAINGTWTDTSYPTKTWNMIASEQYPCTFVKKEGRQYLYSCYFQEKNSKKIKAMIMPSTTKRNKLWETTYNFEQKINKKAPVVSSLPKIMDVKLGNIFSFIQTATKVVPNEDTGIPTNKTYYSVDGKLLNAKEFKHWKNQQDPRQTPKYWNMVNDHFRFSPDMTEDQA